MTEIDLIVPTIDGREDIFGMAVDAYQETCPDGYSLNLIVPENYPTVGEAWNSALSDLENEYVFFSVDDCIPHEGWAEVAVETVEEGFVPAPKLLTKNGQVEACGSMGWGAKLPECADRTPCRSTGIIFLKAEWVRRIGEFLPIHYAVDDDYCWRANLFGYQLLHRSGMVFTHHDEKAAAVIALAPEHVQQALKHMSTLRLPEAV